MPYLVPLTYLFLSYPNPAWSQTMSRQEAANRIATASWILTSRRGWTAAQIGRLVDGLYRDDAVDAIERAAANA